MHTNGGGLTSSAPSAPEKLKAAKMVSAEMVTWRRSGKYRKITKR
jgi:hypothetical protein